VHEKLAGGHPIVSGRRLPIEIVVIHQSEQSVRDRVRVLDFRFEQNSPVHIHLHDLDRGG
jgi:hypothetical protein